MINVASASNVNGIFFFLRNIFGNHWKWFENIHGALPLSARVCERHSTEVRGRCYWIGVQIVFCGGGDDPLLWIVWRADDNFDKRGRFLNEINNRWNVFAEDKNATFTHVRLSLIYINVTTTQVLLAWRLMKKKKKNKHNNNMYEQKKTKITAARRTKSQKWSVFERLYREGCAVFSRPRVTS